MKNDQVQRDGEASRPQRGETEAFIESGRVEESARNAGPRPDAERQERERAEQAARSRSADEDLVLHDDDEAELDLPR